MLSEAYQCFVQRCYAVAWVYNCCRFIVIFAALSSPTLKCKQSFGVFFPLLLLIRMSIFWYLLINLSRYLDQETVN